VLDHLPGIYPIQTLLFTLHLERELYKSNQQI